MPKLACCREPCGTCVYPCDPPPESERDIVYYFTPCEKYIGPPSCGYSINVDVKAGGAPICVTGPDCSNAYASCANTAPSYQERLTYLCLFGDATNGYEFQWSGWTCPIPGYPFPQCTNNYPGGGVNEIAGPNFIGYCNATACDVVSPCTCPAQFATTITGGQFAFYNVNDPVTPFYDPQPWTDVIEIERVCCWDPPPAYQWLTISASGDIIGIGDQNPTPPPVGHRCNIITQSASGQGLSQALQSFLGSDYKVSMLSNEVFWAGGPFYELVFGGCAGKLMSCEADGCSCEGRYPSDEWRVNYIDNCRAVVQARYVTAMNISEIGWEIQSNVQELEIPAGSGNYFCRCSGAPCELGGRIVPTAAVLIQYGVTVDPAAMAWDFDFVSDPNQCDGAAFNCTWCNRGLGIPQVL